MKKFVVIYHAPITALEQMQNATPEEMKAGMEPWMAWANKCGKALVDMGTPLVGGQKITKTGSSSSKRDVCGFSIMQAESMEEVKSLLTGHPHLDWADGCEIEVHESMPMPG